MEQLKVVGAGVGRTGTNSLKLALERLLEGPCHHMFEIGEHPEQIPVWTDAIEGRPVDWHAMLTGYRAIVDWPGGSFWRELSAANPDALVLLSVRDPEVWYRSASNTIFIAIRNLAPPADAWGKSIFKLLHDRFSDDLDNPAAMIEAFVRHNDAVRREVPASRLLEWTPSDGWAPICERLGLAVPDEPFPKTNSTEEFRARASRPTEA